MENSEVKYKNRHQTIINTNFKVCKECNENKAFKNYVALSADITQRRDICRKCEAIIRKNKAIDSHTKHCPKCDKTLNKTEFPSDPSRLDGLYGLCKSCKALQDKEYKINNPEKIRALNKKRMEIPQNKISKNLRTRLGKLVRDKNSGTFEYVGMSIPNFKNWLEYQFDENMNWNNYGSYWEIDHVIPCASFDLTIEDNIYKCFSWENSRPFNASQNSSKNAKIIESEINSHAVIVSKYKKLMNITNKSNKNKEIEV